MFAFTSPFINISINLSVFIPAKQWKRNKKDDDEALATAV
jgi:hypothetical protein